MRRAVDTNGKTVPAGHAGPAAIEGQLGQLLSIKEVVRVTGISRSTIYRLLAAKRFPRPLKISPRRVGWPSGDLTQWLQALRSD